MGVCQPSFSSFFLGAAVADVVDAPEGGDDLFVMGDDDDRGIKLAGGHQVAYIHAPTARERLYRASSSILSRASVQLHCRMSRQKGWAMLHVEQKKRPSIRKLWLCQGMPWHSI